MIKIIMAQLNPTVGNVEGNTQKIICMTHRAIEKCSADIVVFPELCLCGYPPEDLLLRLSMQKRIEKAIERLLAENFHCALIVGYPWMIEGKRYNMAGVLLPNRKIEQYAKQQLPNYQVFDEKRYFESGNTAFTFKYQELRIALSICEDIWHPGPMAMARTEGAQLMINLNASPFHQGKHQQRLELLAKRAQEGAMPIVYVNQVGGQDELVFDGGSFAVDAEGELCVQAPFYEQSLYAVELIHPSKSPVISPQVLRSGLASPPSKLELIYQALVIGLRDYVDKNGFKDAVLGLSGGIDSALTLTIAVDALGADHVSAVMMPFTYTSKLSLRDAADQAHRLGVDYQIISIEPMYQAFMSGLSEVFLDKPLDLTEQNLQARCRGVVLMAMSNKLGSLVLTTGNKSEMSVGYSTLYGDMAGGFNVLKDVPKTQVYSLAVFCNQQHERIPQSIIDRPPSAELAPDQIDEDRLPPYDVLDEILRRYIDLDESAETIIASGQSSELVHRVIRMVDMNEHKRRQAPVGPRISERGFGRDRRYPITNGWRPGV